MSVSTSVVSEKVELIVILKNGERIRRIIRSANDLEISYLNIIKFITSVSGRLAQVKNFTVYYHGISKTKADLISDCMIEFIPEKAPELWPGIRKTEEELDHFFLRVWAKYLRVGLSLSDIRKLDPGLLSALKYHKKCKLPWPKALEIPTQRSDLANAEVKFDQGKYASLDPRQIVAVARKKARESDISSPAGAVQKNVPQRPARKAPGPAMKRTAPAR